jgi:hypothetical protein
VGQAKQHASSLSVCAKPSSPPFAQENGGRDVETWRRGRSVGSAERSREKDGEVEMDRRQAAQHLEGREKGGFQRVRAQTEWRLWTTTGVEERWER